MTTSLTKRRTFRSKKIRDAARGEMCTLNIPFDVCEGDTATTVLAHLPARWGSGTGAVSGKESDLFAVFACGRCHDFLDRRAFTRIWPREQDRLAICMRALAETHARLVERGVLKA